MAGQPLADKRWRWAAASHIGTSHQRAGTRKQDAYGVRNGARAFCAVVCDGAGSASRGGQGASLTCRHLLTRFQTWFLNHDELPSEAVIRDWLDDVRDHLSDIAAKRELTRRQFASTLVMLVVHDAEVLTLQIGDSPLVARGESGWEVLCWPENGEFASSTFFVTDDPEARLHVTRRPLTYDAFALFSDGLEVVALEQSTQQPFARFFDPMIRSVDDAQEHGRLGPLSSSLHAYLGSSKLCERTDDDKTLILISFR